MDCVNIRLNGELIQFDCPNCGIDAEINEDTLQQIWSNFDGLVSCPLPDGCNSFIKIPTKEQIHTLKHPKPKSEPGGINNIIERMNDRKEGEEPDSDEPEEEANPAPSGPFRYVSTSDEATTWAEDFENKKSEKTQKPISSPLAIRTFRNKECIVQGQNRFDDTVSAFLGEIGKENVICVSPINYTDPQDKCPDYGVVVYFQTSDKKASAQPQAEAEPVVWRD
ncbi:MAG: hypothetical protein P8M70_00515 [Verrucomicrobiota bacterium]|nr:hypothetical protein [Verrucomicrobiota bacterium]